MLLHCYQHSVYKNTTVTAKCIRAIIGALLLLLTFSCKKFPFSCRHSLTVFIIFFFLCCMHLFFYFILLSFYLVISFYSIYRVMYRIVCTVSYLTVKYHYRWTWMHDRQPWARHPPPTSTSWPTPRLAWPRSTHRAHPSPARPAPSWIWRGGGWIGPTLTGNRRAEEPRILGEISDSSRTSTTRGMPRSRGKSSK